MNDKRNSRYSSYGDNSHIDGNWNNSGHSFKRLQNHYRPVKGIIRWLGARLRYGKMRRMIL